MKQKSPVQKYNEAVKEFEAAIIVEQRAARFNKAIFEKMDYYLRYTAIQKQWSDAVSESLKGEETSVETITPENGLTASDVYKQGEDYDMDNLIKRASESKSEGGEDV